MEILTQNSNTIKLVKFLEKSDYLTQRLHWSKCIKDQKLKIKISENPRVYEQKILLSWHPILQPLDNFSQVATNRSSSKNIGIMKI
jgi:hypothetical protein